MHVDAMHGSIHGLLVAHRTMPITMSMNVMPIGREYRLCADADMHDADGHGLPDCGSWRAVAEGNALMFFATPIPALMIGRVAVR